MIKKKKQTSLFWLKKGKTKVAEARYLKKEVSMIKQKYDVRNSIKSLINSSVKIA